MDKRLRPAFITVEAHQAAMNNLKRRWAMTMLRQIDLGSIRCPRFRDSRHIQSPPCLIGRDPDRCTKAREKLRDTRDWSKCSHVLDCWLAWIDAEMDAKPGYSWLDQVLIEAGELSE